MTPEPDQFGSVDEALAYVRTDECKQRFEMAKRAMRTLSIEVTPGDAEMVAAWAAEGLKGVENPVAHAAVRRFRSAFDAAARASDETRRP